jgi:YNFM family putative membrane transporter
MSLSLFSVGLLTVASAFAPSWEMLLLFRTLEGVALGGIPAVAMAYLAEEIHHEDLGGAMGLYIAGNAFGGMVGRVLTGILIDISDSWRVALGTMGVLGLVTAIIFVTTLPVSRHFKRRPSLSLKGLGAAFAHHFKDEGLPWLFVMGLLLMGSFVTVYNYISFRLFAPPFELGQAQAGVIFLVYLFGIPASAWFGQQSGRLGSARMLVAAIAMMFFGLGLTLFDNLIAVVAGVATITAGFFGGHSIASGWVGRRAKVDRGQAASLYLFFYYLGSSLIGTLGGFFWARAHWFGVSALVTATLAGAFAVALRLARIKEGPSVLK